MEAELFWYFLKSERNQFTFSRSVQMNLILRKLVGKIYQPTQSPEHHFIPAALIDVMPHFNLSSLHHPIETHWFCFTHWILKLLQQNLIASTQRNAAAFWSEITSLSNPVILLYIPPSSQSLYSCEIFSFLHQIWWTDESADANCIQ